MRKATLLVLLGGLALSLGCGGSSSRSNGGGGGGASGNNVQPVVIDGGPVANQVYVNGIFTSVTVCNPGSSSCQTIDHVLVDTGSYGLRVLAQAADSAGGLTLSLPQANDSTGRPYAECTKFADLSYLWGSVRMADVKMGGTANAGKVASNIPINVVGDASFATIPSACSTGGTNANSQAALGANGILGVGVFPQDCGPACVSGGTPPIPNYYVCPSSGCTASFIPLQQQVSNPVVGFATDNNGVIIDLPAISATGSGSVSGSMIFGIGTQSNNALPSAPHIFAIDGFGDFRTTYKGTNYGPRSTTPNTDSYIDSGSNGIFFPDTITACGTNATGFFCPSSTMNLSATQVGVGGSPSNMVNFSIANAQTLFSGNNGTNVAFSNLGGTNTGVFDWGLPFFFGQKIYSAIYGQTTPASTSPPYWAY